MFFTYACVWFEDLYHFVDLYQASLKDKSKHVDTHAIKNALVEANVEINNVMFKKISLAHEVAKSLEFLDLLHNKASDWWMIAQT